MDIHDPCIVLDLLKVLTTPKSGGTEYGNIFIDKTPKSGGTEYGNQDSLNGLLQSTLQNYFDESKKPRYKSIEFYFEEKQDIDLENHEIPIKWKFTCHCLKILEILCISIKKAMVKFQSKQDSKKSVQGSELKPSQAPPLSPDTLSIGQQKTFLTAIQFIIIFGVSPYLQEGVGLHTAKRTCFGGVLALEDLTEQLDYIERNLRVIKCMKGLIDCCKIENLGTIIMSRHLGDILAALLQLVHGQKGPVKIASELKKTDNDRENSHPKLESTPSDKWTPALVVDMAIANDLSVQAEKELIKRKDVEYGDNYKTDGSEVMTVNCDNYGSVAQSRSLTKEDIDFCEESLNNLLDNISQPLLVRELMVLQGGPGIQPVKKGDGVNRQTKPVLTRAPVWLRKICGQLLTGILMKPQGVIHVLHGMLGNAVADAKGNIIADWRKFDAVAKVIASCPKRLSSAEEYYEQVAPQILSLLHHPNKQVAKHFLRVAYSTIANTATSNPDLTEKFFIRPLLKPLISCTQDKDFDPNDNQGIIVEEQSLALCIEDIHKLFVSGSDPSSTLSTYLVPVIHPLFQIYCFSKQGVSHLRSSLHEILVTCLKQSLVDQALQYLKFLVLGIPSVSDLHTLHPNLVCAAGQNGGIVIVTKHGIGDYTQQQTSTEGVLDLLKDLQRQGLTGDFFLFMMKELSNIIREEIQSTGSKKIQNHNVLDIDITQRKIQILNLLASMCDVIGPTCLTNTQQTLDFVEVTLERAVHVLNSCNDEMTVVFENETLTMAMGLITSVLSGGLKCCEKDRDHMQKFLPLLQSLTGNHPDSEVQEMASDLRVAIATHGVVWSERLSKSSNTKEDTAKKSTGSSDIKTSPKNRPLIEEIGGAVQVNLGKDGELTCSPLEKALEELCDPLLPVRGHGLISLCKLVENNDKDTMAKQEAILKIFEENLKHPDSYLYLTSVRGLTLLADKYPNVIIPKLASEFANFDKTERKSEQRMKIGESLVQITRKLGDVAPRFRDILLPALLAGARDKDPFVRASSLSNLGEVCKVLRYSLGNVIQEIFICCQSLLKTDDDVEVRKAAALLTTLLLQGIGRDILLVLDSLLKDLYKLLKITLTTEKDEKVKVHIMLSLNELDVFMRDYLFPKQTLQKKIRVLDQT